MLLAINGFKRAGKSTVAEYLTKAHGFEELAFAESLKQAVAALFDIPREDVDRYKDLNADVTLCGRIMPFRSFLQRFGTEMARGVWHQDFWVDQLLPSNPNWHKSKLIVISDARFENELRRIRGQNGYTIQVVRPDVESDGHSSELEPPTHLIDFQIQNTGTIQELYDEVEKVLTQIATYENPDG